MLSKRRKPSICFIIYELDYSDYVAIAYLSAMARELGCSRYFYCLKNNERNVEKKIIDLNPDIIAYSTHISFFNHIFNFHQKIKKKINFRSILGGPYATFNQNSFRDSGMDAYCVGEGEYAFQDFINCYIRNESFDDVPNLITKNRRNPVRHLIENLDELPMPDRDLTISSSFLKNTSKKTFYTSRGCPFSCSYCCNNYYNELYKGKGKKVRRFSVDRLLDEIKMIKQKYRMDFVKFGDDLFVAKADDWLMEFADKYKTEIGIPFNCYLRFDIVKEDVLNLLQKAGCYSVHLSVDSTSEYVRETIFNRQMAKHIDIVDKLQMIKNYHIETWVNYMLAAPGSSVEDDINSIYWNKSGQVTCPSYSTTTPMVGTDLYEYCINNNMLDSVYDMAAWGEKSQLKCFSEKDKNIRYNILLTGAFISKCPLLFIKLGIIIIRNVPPNFLFKFLHKVVYSYFYKYRIYKLGKWFLKR